MQSFPRALQFLRRISWGHKRIARRPRYTSSPMPTARRLAPHYTVLTLFPSNRQWPPLSALPACARRRRSPMDKSCMQGSVFTRPYRKRCKDSSMARYIPRLDGRLATQYGDLASGDGRQESSRHGHEINKLPSLREQVGGVRARCWKCGGGATWKDELPIRSARASHFDLRSFTPLPTTPIVPPSR